MRIAHVRRCTRTSHRSLALVAVASGLLAGCGGSTTADIPTPKAGAAAIPLAAGTSASGAPAQRLREWPEFGLDPQRSDVS